MPQPLRPVLQLPIEQWEDLARECGGWEYIDAEATGTNEFGEKVGMDRLKEALEATEWEGGDGGIEDEGLDEMLGLNEGEILNTEDLEVESDGPGIREAILGQSNGKEGDGQEKPSGNLEGQEGQTEELEVIMLKMQAIKGMSLFSLQNPCSH